MKKNKFSTRRGLDHVFTYTALLIMAGIFLFPCLWLILASFSKTGRF